MVTKLASVGIMSETESNLFGLKRECAQEMNGKPMATVKSFILVLKTSVREPDKWRFGCLRKYLDERYQLKARLEETTLIDSLIDSLCSSLLLHL